MRANVVHTDLNPCGGAEQLAVATLQALVEMGFRVDLTTAKEPDVGRLEGAFGRAAGRVLRQVEQTRPLGDLPEGAAGGGEGNPYDITINTHGDILPYYLPSLSRKNAITYCHYPVAAEYIRDRDPVYLQTFAELGLLREENAARGGAGSQHAWERLERNFALMLKNTFVVTNSQFSRQAIAGVLALRAGDLAVVPPPVNVEDFREAALSSYPGSRTDSVLVVSRINPSKKLENAIELAGMLAGMGAGKEVILAGNLAADRYCLDYYRRLLGMVREKGLQGYVRIMPNVGIGELRALMGRCKVYFHPMPAEPFGISIAEAMSAGLVPVVPDVGGQTEFVPKKYQFSSLREAASIIAESMSQVTEAERLLLSNSVARFSSAQYVARMQALIRSMVAAAPPPLSSSQQQLSAAMPAPAATVSVARTAVAPLQRLHPDRARHPGASAAGTTAAATTTTTTTAA